MAEQRKELGRRIAEARKAKGWKQKQLAAAVHVEPTTVSRWENGRHAPDIDLLEEIARATEKPLAFFVDEAATDDRAAEILDLRAQLADVQGKVALILQLLQEQAKPPARTARRRSG